MTNIPPGYMLSVVSSEGDSDNYKTTTLVGLTESDVRFYTRFCQLFYPDHEDPKAFGNKRITVDHEEAIAKEAIELYRQFQPSSLTEEYQQYLEQDFNKGKPVEEFLRDIESDIQYDLIGPWNDGYYYRVFDSFTVHLVEHECQDKTTEFS